MDAFFSIAIVVDCGLIEVGRGGGRLRRMDEIKVPNYLWAEREREERSKPAL